MNEDRKPDRYYVRRLAAQDQYWRGGELVIAETLTGYYVASPHYPFDYAEAVEIERAYERARLVDRKEP